MQNLPQILRGEFTQRKERNPNFSLRSFARWLEISPAQLSQLMSGKRPMTLKMATKISTRLGHSPTERLEFLKASLPEWLEDEPNVVNQILSEDRFRLIADWYHLAILSLTKLPKANSDPRWIARRLGISVGEAREGADRLVRLGLLQLKPSFRQLGSPFSVDSNIPSAAIRTFHKQNLALAAEKIETVPMELRELQSITMNVNTRKLPLARKLLIEAISKIESVLESGNTNEVYTLAFQLFPVSQSESKGESDL